MPLSPYRIRGFGKPFLLDLEEDLDLGRVERGHREAEVLRDERVLNFLNDRRAIEGALAMLGLHLDGLVDIVYPLIHEMQLCPQEIGGVQRECIRV
ncbi:hypothetical protein GW17_00052879 [Ensete ventricosum]|nr:hypothetical protein GW17_00052879 [Ensete ventricosum]